MEDIYYKVKIKRTWYVDEVFEEEDEVEIPVPKNTQNVYGFIKYVLKITKRRDESIEIIDIKEKE